MPLTQGTKLGPYEIVSPLGAGGMGEVYRARDTRLGRDVAVKVLPQHLSANPEVRARFEREAKTVSSLNHPHICTLFDVGREGDTDYLVMELVEGDTLAQRLEKGALPTVDVLKLGAQIADALDRAHRAGVVHRDLKPGNVMITKAGAKLMDFGLARAAGLAAGTGSGSAMTTSPTVAQALTAEGTIVGTFQYMSPEQLEGREADARCDIWALGCVLYEMATGRRAFEGRSQASLISAIMTGEPAPVSQISPTRPQALDRLIGRCFAKEPDDRWQTARDLMHELRAIGGASTTASGVVTGAPTRGVRRQAVAWWPVALAAVVAFSAGALLSPRLYRANRAERAYALEASIPAGLSVFSNAGDLALAPDGSAMVLVLRDSAGVNRLWLRPLGKGPARALEGTEGAVMPFWSPDGGSIGYFTTKMLRRVSIAGGSSQDICAAADGRGASWGRNGTILFAPGAEGPIYRVAAQGGRPEPATVLDSTRHEIGHRFPRFLPDGKHFLFSTTPLVENEHEVFIAELGAKQPRFVFRCDGTPTFSREGWLLFRHNRILFAQRFDPGSARLSAEPRPLFQTGTFFGFQAAPSVWITDGGLLVTIPEGSASSRLAWADRAGKIEPIAGIPRGTWVSPSLSQDGSRIMASLGSAESGMASGYHLWMTDLSRGLSTRFTFDANAAFNPIWSPNASEVIYSSNMSGAYALYSKRTVGASEPRFIARSAGLLITPTDWTRDGRYLLYEASDPHTSGNIYIFPMDGSGKATPMLATPANEEAASVSPDGRWVVYCSDENGRPEVFVDAFPGLGSKRQVSTGGGRQPYWRSDGRELFYLGLDRTLFSVEATPGASIETSPPSPLFKFESSIRDWCPAPDGRRFLVVEADQDQRLMKPQVVVHWTHLLEGAK